MKKEYRKGINNCLKNGYVLKKLERMIEDYAKKYEMTLESATEAVLSDAIYTLYHRTYKE